MNAKRVFGLMMACLMVGVLVSCTSAQKQEAVEALPIPPTVVLQDAVKVGMAAAQGYLVAGKVGAAAAATAQEVSNIKVLQNGTVVPAQVVMPSVAAGAAGVTEPEPAKAGTTIRGAGN
jgi:hypothetical protein